MQICLGKPPTFDGNASEYQHFRIIFGIHMGLFSPISQLLMDKCEAERGPISLAGVKALCEVHMKCCMQMYYSLALITTGSV